MGWKEWDGTLPPACVVSACSMAATFPKPVMAAPTWHFSSIVPKYSPVQSCPVCPSRSCLDICYIYILSRPQAALHVSASPLRPHRNDNYSTASLPWHTAIVAITDLNRDQDQTTHCRHSSSWPPKADTTRGRLQHEEHGGTRHGGRQCPARFRFSLWL